jgi:hypothetical protein
MTGVYAEKYKDPRWQKKRLEILERDGWKCKLCGNKNNTLHVHHFYYERNKDPWDYPNDALVTLCEFCHEEEPAARKENEDNLLEFLRHKRFLSFDIEALQMYIYWNGITTDNVFVLARKAQENHGADGKIEEDIKPKKLKPPKLCFSFDDECFHNITEKHLTRWKETYPACDIERELRKMREWLLSNRAKGHKSNWARFITNWLSRSQDKGGTR